jgi:acetylornithine/N-succinyldiaminopimelate aminotransferase
MTFSEIQAIEDACSLPTYKKWPIALERGAGTKVWDTEGREYLDFYGGHCVTALGHCPPEVTTAIREQSESLLFYSNLVYSPVRAKATRLAADLAPEGLGNLFLCNSGTEANETALKLARRHTGRHAFIAMEGGFHGRTVGSLAVTGIDKYRAPYKEGLPEAHFVPFGDAGAVADILESGEIAAVILEPIQSMAGVMTAPPSYFAALRRACDAAGTMLIFDEVQTGVGRCGAFTFAQLVGVTPDLITMAKSLGSGVPVGAVFASDAIRDGIQFGDQGTTFGGGMLAMAAMAATLETISEQKLMNRAAEIFDAIRVAVGNHVKEVRGSGCLIGIDLGAPAGPVIGGLREHGILTGGADDPNVIRIMPPLNTSDSDIAAFSKAFESVVQFVATPA